MSKMKMLPVQLSLNSLNPGIWNDVLWRCPPAPSSQLAELKTQLPPSLPSDPRLWSREDVLVFLRFCVREFDLPKLDFDLFQMNGKALCLLTRADFGHRCPGAGDVLHNVLQMLIIESHMMQWHLPNSPVTPTSRYPLSPHSHPPTPTWPPLNAPPENSPFHSSAHGLAGHHFMAPNSVTLSPPPSVDSQASSPPQAPYQNGAVSGGAATVSGPTTNAGGATNNSNPTSSSASSTGSNGTQPNIMPMKGISSASSNHSDSEEEYSETSGGVGKLQTAPLSYSTASPPGTPILKDIKPNWTQQLTNSFVNSWSQQQQQQQQQQAAAVAAAAAQAQQQQQLQQQQQQQMPQKLTLDNTAGPVVTPAGGSISAPTTPSYMYKAKREFFPENSEPNTNGRLLWDFLQQLLNDRNQKYSDLIAWKCRDTGVFKIVDPAGLAKLWGIQKNHLSMNYDKMSRALRYYYRVNILRKVQGERHCYQFLRNPTELKNIKNISLLRQSTPANGNGNGSSMPQGSNQAPGSPAGQNWNPQQQQQSQQQQQQSPQRPASRNGPMSLPAVAAVAAAAAAAYGPPPTSPLFMHAINGAFHYLSAAAAGPPPNSPALNTPSAVGGPDKFQFHPLKLENSSGSGSESAGEDLKPTDLSVSSKSNATSNEDCYPLIRNADGLTTIKLIRYNDHQGAASPAEQSPKSDDQQPAASTASSSPRPMDQVSEQAQPVPMDSDCNGGESEDSFRHMRQ
ncbi:LOW QUALITY PROTEIN: ets DNA-binding protein pokkuri [Drosophila eugracilis]|uniref:LOW QUALITY PROTEIN: ets DNA-binding protein pokkuri n=1 Tax=Drosophila eugracilis TaxID=29029 RepID=UPI001BDA4465|nr:LOW QUALITY PROTEIN: ets DNA-binding protein pokkuri [Drosophila eugracilis]